MNKLLKMLLQPQTIDHYPAHVWLEYMMNSHHHRCLVEILSLTAVWTKSLFRTGLKFPKTLHSHAGFRYLNILSAQNKRFDICSILLTAVVMNFAVSFEVRSESINFSWDSGHDGTIIFDGISIHPPYVLGRATDTYSDGNVRDRAIEKIGGKTINTENLDTFVQLLNKIHDYIRDSDIPGFDDLNPTEIGIGTEFTYGTWYLKRLSSCTGGVCSDVRRFVFIPNEESIIDNLTTDNNITSEYTYVLKRNNGQEFASGSTTVEIRVDKSDHRVGFEFKSRNHDTAEGENTVLNVIMNSPLSNDITIPFTITPGSAVETTDYTPPANLSITIPSGKTSGIISIPTVHDPNSDVDKKFTVTLTDGSNYTFSPRATVATVNVVNKDSPTLVAPGGKACHDVSQPGTVTTPNTRAYWETKQDDLDIYYPKGGHFNLRMGFKEPVKESTKFYFGVYFANGDPENTSLYTEPAVDSTGEDIRINSPRDGGYYQYRVLPTSLTDDEVWYEVVADCQLGVWWTDASRPGITLSIEESTVFEGNSFRVTATATPRPNRDILVPIYFSDNSRIEAPQDLQIRITSGQASGYVDVATSYLGGVQSALDVTVSTEWRSRFWLDDSVKSDVIAIIDTVPAIWSGAETDNEGHALLEIEPNTTYRDLTATLNFSIPTDAFFRLNSSSEWINSVNTTTGDFRKATDEIKESLPDDFDKDNTHVYGSGTDNPAGTFTYGYWVFDGERLLFRPINSNLATLPLGTKVESVLGLNFIQWPDKFLTTVWFRVTLRNRGVILKWDDNTAWTRNVAGNLRANDSNTPTSLSGSSTIRKSTSSMVSVSASDTTAAVNNGMPKDIQSTTSAESGFSKEIDSDYGTWLWKQDDSGFRFDPDWNAVNLLGNGNYATTTLTARIVDSGVEQSKSSVTLTLFPQVDRSNGTHSVEWKGGHDGELLFSSSISSYPNKLALFELDRSTHTGFGWRSQAIETDPSGVTKSTVFNKTWSFNTDAISESDHDTFTGNEFVEDNGFRYGTWYISRPYSDQGLPCASEYCYDILFKPNTANINMLDENQEVTSKFAIHTINQQIQTIVKKEVVVTIKALTLPTISVANSTTAVAEDGVELTLNFTLDRQSDEDVTIATAVSSESTAESADYTLGSTSPLTIIGGSGNISVPLAVTIADDAVYEGDEKIVLDLTVTNAEFSGGASTHELTVTITDNESKPEISFKTATQNTREGQSFDLTLVASGQSESSYSIKYTLTNTTGDFLEIPGGATESDRMVDSDFTLNGQSLEQTLSIATRAANGSADNAGEISATLDTPAGTAPYTVDSTKQTVSVTVADEFALPTITVTEPDSTVVAENGGTLTYNFNLTGLVSGTEMIATTHSTDSTAESADYRLSDIAFTGRTATLTITIEDDAVFEGDETLVLSMSATEAEFSTESGTSSNFNLTITITDDEAKPNVSFKSSTLSVTEGAPIHLVLVASGPAESTYSIGYTLTNTKGDFLEIPVGATESNQMVDSDFALNGQVLEQVLSIATRTANESDDGEGEISVVLDTPEETAPYTVDSAKSTVSVTVTDLSSLPTISVTSPDSTIVEENVGALTYSFELSDSPSGNESITPGLATGSSAESEDYKLSDIAFNGRTATLTITIDDDAVYEGEETLILDLTAANAVFSDSAYTHTLTITITDNESKPEISFKTETETVAEGVSFDLTLLASVASEETYSIGYSISNAKGNFLAIPNGGTEVERSIDSNFEYNAASQMLEQSFFVATRAANGMKEENGEISVALDTPEGTAQYTVADTMNTVTISVVDDSVHVVSIKASSPSVVEGEDIEIVLNCNPPPANNLDVGLKVTQTGDNLVWPIRRQVIFTSNSGTINLKLNTISNPNTSETEVVTVAVIGTNDFMAGSPVSVPVMKPSQDASQVGKYSVVSAVITEILQQIPPTPPQGESTDAKPTLSIHAVRGSVAEGELAVFTVSASHAISSGLPVKIKLSQTGDFIVGPLDRTLNLNTDLFESELAVATDNDSLAEADGRIIATVQADSEYLVGTQKSAHVIVSDAMGRQHRKNHVSNALNDILPDLLAYSTARTVEIARNRITQGFSGSPATSIELNGKSPVLTALQSGGKMLNDSSTDWQSLIDDSSFTVALYPEGGETSPATVWGVGDKWSLSSDGNGEQQSWEGEIHAGHFGFDARVGPGMLAGLAMSVSQSKINYGQNGDSRMSFDAMATGIHPYLGISTSDGNSRLQIVAGYGENELELKQEKYLPEVLQVHYDMVAIGGSSSVYSTDSFGGLQNLELSVAGEAWHARQFVDSVPGVTDNLQVDARHVRIAIEESHDHHFGNFGTLSPSLSVGLRGDGSNEKSVFGLNLDNGIKFASLNGLEISGSGKSMLSGLNRISRWEIAGAVNYDSGNHGKGILFSMSPTWSGGDSTVESQIWQSKLGGVLSNSFNSVADQEFAAEIGYGLEVLGGSVIATPFHAYKQTGKNGIELRFGSRFATNVGISFELEVARDKSETSAVAHEFKLAGGFNW